MSNHKKLPPPPSGRTNLASCIVATIFLIFITIIVLIIFFTLFKPKNPTISVTAVQLPSFSITNTTVTFTVSHYIVVNNPNRGVFAYYDSSLQLLYAGNQSLYDDFVSQVTAVQLPSFSITNTTVTFTVSHYIVVNNPNRGVFAYYDSSLQLLYAGNQVGFMFIPTGKIEAHRTTYMAATFSIKSFPISLVNDNYPVEGINGLRVRSSLEIVTRMEMAGRVRVLHFFTHHVDGRVECKVIVAINDGSVLGFYC